MNTQLVLTMNAIEDAKEDQFGMDDVATAADNGDIALWDAQTGTHIATLEYAGGIYSLEFLADGQLASGNEPSLWERVFIISAISKSGRASSSYTDYDAFVMLGHIHFILYTQPDDGPEFYLDLNINYFSSNILLGAYWVF